MKFGVNDQTLAAFNTAGINPTLVRCYNPPKVNVPASFPGPDAKTTIKGGSQVVSFRPSITDAIAGKLDAQIKTYFAGVPEGAYVTAWHEGEGARFNYTGQQIIALHERMMDLFSQAAPLSASYGQMFMAYSASPAGRGIKPFLCVGLDFYGIDAYGDGTNDPVSVIEPALEQLGESAMSDLLITESNTPNPAQCSEWHRRAYRYAKSLSADAYMPFFGTGVGGQVFNPNDAALVETLKECAR